MPRTSQLALVLTASVSLAAPLAGQVPPVPPPPPPVTFQMPVQPARRAIPTRAACGRFRSGPARFPAR